MNWLTAFLSISRLFEKLDQIIITLTKIPGTLAAILTQSQENNRLMSQLSDAIANVQTTLTTFHADFNTAIADLQAKIAAGGQVTPEDLTALGNMASEIGGLDEAAKTANPGTA